MKSLAFFLIVILGISSFEIFSQPWSYNLGSTTGSFNTANGVSTTFLPAPLSGISRIRVSSTGGGSFNLENQLISFGENVYLRIIAPATASVNKFSLYDYTAGKTFTLRFNVRFGASDGSNSGAASGTWYLFIGDGATFSDNASFAGGQVFTGIRFAFGASGIITTNFRSASTWTAAGITGTPFTQGINYTVEIYGNNSTSAQTYNHGSAQSVASNTWDMWVNGTIVGDDLAKAIMINDLNIDSWMFYGESSTGNAANIFLDDFYYQNIITNDPLPVTISYFNAAMNKRNIILKWETTQEINNNGFDIERRSFSNGSESFNSWQKIGFIAGNGTISETRDYYYEDKNLSVGKYEYRLKQIDYNGNFEFFTLNSPAYIVIGKPIVADIGQNYPNPSNPKCKIDYQLPYMSKVSIKIFDIIGHEIFTLVNEFKEEGYYTMEFDGTNLASGVYFYSLIAEGNNDKFAKTLKMILVK